MPNIAQSAVETANYVAGKVDPYVPKVAKDAASFAADKASSALDYTQKTVNGTVEYAQKTVSGTVDYAQKTVTGTVDYAKNTVAAAQSFASEKATSALEFGKVVANGATTTLTAYTPGPVVNLVQSTVENAKALRQDPVATMKPYVPSFVIHAGEKTYEIVVHAKDTTAKSVQATTGFIVTKVKGTVQSVTSVPAIQNLIEQIQKVTGPVLTRLGVSPKSQANGKHESEPRENGASEDAPVLEDAAVDAKEQ